MAYHRVRGKPRGKPEGGSGGSGGDVLVIADPNVSTLLDYRRRPHRRAGDGTHGRGDLRDGRRGEDLTLSLPIGTVVRDHDDVILADLAKPGFVVTLVEGGRGGRGNASLVSRRHHAPSFAEQGEYGEERMFTFELKLITDAALIGFPNAGKSTMISRVSAARPQDRRLPLHNTRAQPRRRRGRRSGVRDGGYSRPHRRRRQRSRPSSGCATPPCSARTSPSPTSSRRCASPTPPTPSRGASARPTRSSAAAASCTPPTPTWQACSARSPRPGSPSRASRWC